MPTYINPLALETPNGFKAQGALGGFLAGMNQDLANQMVGQSMQETNLDMATKQQALDLANATQQDKVDEANAIAAKARQDQQYADSGDYAAMRASNDTAKKAGNDLSVVQDQVNQQLAPAKLYQQMSAEMQQIAPNGLDPMNPDHVSWYDSWYKRLRQFTPNMPQMIQPNTSGVINQKGMQAQQFIQAVGTNPDFQNKMALAKQQQDASYNQATDVARITADSRRDVADARAQAQRDVQGMKDQVAKYAQRNEALLSSSVDKINQQPGGVLDGDISHNMAIAESWAENKAIIDLKDNATYKILSLAPDGSPERMQADGILQQRIQSNLKAVKGYATAKAGGAASATTPQDTTQATASTTASPTTTPTQTVPRISTKADYDNLKSGSHYIDARDGKTKVKS